MPRFGRFPKSIRFKAVIRIGEHEKWLVVICLVVPIVGVVRGYRMAGEVGSVGGIQGTSGYRVARRGGKSKGEVTLAGAVSAVSLQSSMR